jgi:hypothetical protein
MPLLRFIDVGGKEQDATDVNHLYELIQAGQLGYDSLVRDESSGRWVPARNHELFVRIQDIAMQAPAPRAPSSPPILGGTLPQRAPKARWINSIWPEVSTRKGASNAILAGAAALAWLGASYAFSLIFIFTTGSGLFLTIEDDAQLYSTVGIEIFLICLAELLAWLLWKRQSLIVAWIGLIWTAVEVGAKLMFAPGKGVAVSIILLIASVNGVRGATAMRASDSQK